MKRLSWILLCASMLAPTLAGCGNKLDSQPRSAQVKAFQGDPDKIKQISDQMAQSQQGRPANAGPGSTPAGH